MFTLFIRNYFCIPIFTPVYLCLHMFTYVYHCLPMFTRVYLCLLMFTTLYSRLSTFTTVCSCLFTDVYILLMVAQRYNPSTGRTVVGAEQKSYRAHANSRWAQAENLRAHPKSHRAISFSNVYHATIT